MGSAPINCPSAIPTTGSPASMAAVVRAPAIAAPTFEEKRSRSTMSCPAVCITIDSDVGPDGTRRTTRYDIDLFKCIYCGFCEEACPVDAIVLTRINDYHMENRGENIMTKDKLLAIGEKYEAMIAADKAADSRYR